MGVQTSLPRVAHGARAAGGIYFSLTVEQIGPFIIQLC